MTVHVDQLRLRLPPEFGPRAEAIARAVARGIAQLQTPESRTLKSLTFAPILIDPTASDSQVTDAVIRQLAAALGASL
jgi:formaldehyde-activating enzyme involved in methanogenesis